MDFGGVSFRDKLYVIIIHDLSFCTRVDLLRIRDRRGRGAGFCAPEPINKYISATIRHVAFPLPMPYMLKRCYRDGLINRSLFPTMFVRNLNKKKH